MDNRTFICQVYLSKIKKFQEFKEIVGGRCELNYTVRIVEKTYIL